MFERNVCLKKVKLLMKYKCITICVLSNEKIYRVRKCKQNLRKGWSLNERLYELQGDID